MRSVTLFTRRAIVAAFFASTMGFGTVQALATPAARGESCVAGCNPRGCDRACRAQGGIEGRCNAGRCLCLF